MVPRMAPPPSQGGSTLRRRKRGRERGNKREIEREMIIPSFIPHKPGLNRYKGVDTQGAPLAFTLNHSLTPLCIHHTHTYIHPHNLITLHIHINTLHLSLSLITLINLTYVSYGIIMLCKRALFLLRIKLNLV